MRGGSSGSDIPDGAVVLVDTDPSEPSARSFMAYEDAKKQGLF